MGTTLYVIRTDGKETGVVEAQSQAQAIRHAARGKFSAEPVSAKELARLFSMGLKIEQAKPEQIAIAGTAT